MRMSIRASILGLVLLASTSFMLPTTMLAAPNAASPEVIFPDNCSYFSNVTGVDPELVLINEFWMGCVYRIIGIPRGWKMFAMMSHPILGSSTYSYNGVTYSDGKSRIFCNLGPEVTITLSQSSVALGPQMGSTVYANRIERVNCP